MSKKSKPSKQKKQVIANSSPVDRALDLIGHLIFQGDYQQAVAHCERLLNYLPQQAQQRAEVLSQLGVAHAMLQNFRKSYEVLTEALTFTPKNAELWYNRSTANRFALRIGQSIRDLEQAIELNTRSELREKYHEELQFCRKMAQTSIELRGPDFTLDQLIEQETLFQQGLQFMEAEKLEEAGQASEASIAMGDCLPQPWGNLGVCLLMQERYDEAEAALKRALVLDPNYTLAKDNLAALPEIRRTGPPRVVFDEATESDVWMFLADWFPRKALWASVTVNYKILCRIFLTIACRIEDQGVVSVSSIPFAHESGEFGISFAALT